MTFDLACIVEGHGEVEAVPVTIRRIASLVSQDLVLRIHQPFRVPRNRLVKPDELERSVELAARRAGREEGAILIVLDGDDECPATSGPPPSFDKLVRDVLSLVRDLGEQRPLL